MPHSQLSWEDIWSSGKENAGWGRKFDIVSEYLKVERLSIFSGNTSFLVLKFLPHEASLMSFLTFFTLLLFLPQRGQDDWQSWKRIFGCIKAKMAAGRVKQQGRLHSRLLPRRREASSQSELCSTETKDGGCVSPRGAGGRSWRKVEGSHIPSAFAYWLYPKGK